MKYVVVAIGLLGLASCTPSVIPSSHVPIPSTDPTTILPSTPAPVDPVVIAPTVPPAPTAPSVDPKDIHLEVNKAMTNVDLQQFFTAKPIAFMITPTLPSGLNLNRQTGVISGTPAVIKSIGNYTMKAYYNSSVKSDVVKIQITGLDKLDYDCGCKHTIGVNENSFDGVARSVKAGDKICLESGTRTRQLILSNIVGTVAKPVVISNCIEKVLINTNDSHGIEIKGSKYFRLTGLADPYNERGIVIQKTSYTGRSSGIDVTGMSSDYEIDHIEIKNTDYGLYLRTAWDSGYQCDAKYPSWTGHTNLKLHHNVITDIQAKGYFVGTGLGNNLATTRVVNCSGVDKTVPLDGLTNVEIYNNTTQRTGFNGIQVGFGSKIMIHDNTILAHGMQYDNVQWEDFGINMQSGARGEVYNNWVDTAGGKGTAFQAFTVGDLKVYNNVFMNSLSMFYISDISNGTYSNFVFAHNTAINIANQSTMDVRALNAGVAFTNNLYVNTETIETYGRGINAHNIHLNTISEAKFASFDDKVLVPLSTSPVYRVGSNLGTQIKLDATGYSRPASGGWSLGAFENP